jgi:predicted outer membrane protein
LASWEQEINMKRRLVVASLAAALGAGALRPQAAHADETESGLLGDLERQYVQRMRAAGALSLALSRLAAKKGDDDDVKEFVQFEISEQEAIFDILNGVDHPGQLSGRIKAPSEDEIAPLLDAKAKDATLQLDQQKIGSPFDQAYIRLQIDGHKQLSDIQTDYLRSGRNALLVAVAKLTRRTTKEHLTLLSDIDAALGRG